MTRDHPSVSVKCQVFSAGRVSGALHWAPLMQAGRSGLGEEHHLGLVDGLRILHPFLELVGRGLGPGLVKGVPFGENGDLIRVARRLKDPVTGAAIARAHGGQLVEDLAPGRITRRRRCASRVPL